MADASPPAENFLKEELFVPFRQADHFGSGRPDPAIASSCSLTLPSQTGAGLGVSISDAIVRRMNGTLHFASELGAGTTASIVLPLEVVTSASARPKRAARILSDELSALFRPLIIAEKNEDLETLRRGATTPRPINLPLPQLPPEGSALPSGKDDDVFRVLIADDNPIAR